MPRRRLSLYKALKIGYLRNERKQKKRLKRFGYRLDEELSNNERTVAFSPFTNKLLFIENGSEVNLLKNPVQFVEDWKNNVVNVSTGNFTKSQRFKDAQNAYLKAKDKYKEAKFEMVGHSQSSITINELAKKGDRGLTFNGALIKQKDNKNVENYRMKNDLVSSLANPDDMKTLYKPQQNNQNFLNAHAVDNLKYVPIFI
jgi:hypothetical protein